MKKVQLILILIFSLISCKDDSETVQDLINSHQYLYIFEIKNDSITKTEKIKHIGPYIFGDLEESMLITYEILKQKNNNISGLIFLKNDNENELTFPIIDEQVITESHKYNINEFRK